ncbi:hypothetical protein EVAR_74603_1 [Eumeta japonica]|uniref:Uncharacterized protein n=1 Tax=Eumeta variegata TaxID=151549 RepID=A0A4C1W9N4_EUMVA|nr:hypothetical protein EVAR_74603_1 [Eumeta japonica]
MECFSIPVTDNKARKHLLQPEKWKRNFAKTVRWLCAPKQEQYVIGDVFKVANGSTTTPTLAPYLRSTPTHEAHAVPIHILHCDSSSKKLRRRRGTATDFPISMLNANVLYKTITPK